MILRFNAPLNVSSHFSVAVDHTPWNPQTHLKNKQGWTPVRDRATFGTWAKGLDPLGTFPHWDGNAYPWEDIYGLYLFAADLPQPTLYIGIASNDSATPEGALVRLKKHRVKTTGSHVGSNTASVGGVHHPNNWRNFAVQRFLGLGGAGDMLTDVRFAVAMIVGNSVQRKADLERFEKAIIRNQSGVRDAIIAKLWPHLSGSHKVNIINGTTGSLTASTNGDPDQSLGPQDLTMPDSSENIQIGSQDQIELW